jgi:uncharacterized protein YjdB
MGEQLQMSPFRRRNMLFRKMEPVRSVVPVTNIPKSATGDELLDTTFNSPNGFITRSIFDGQSCIGNQIIVDNGKYVVTGYASDGSISKLFIIRYDSNGNLDTSFNSPNGFITRSIIDGQYCFGNQIIVDNGKYVVTGDAYAGGGLYKLFIIRYLGSTTTTTTTTTKPPIRVTSVRLNATKATIKIKGTKRLIATILPTNASNKSIRWTTSNSKIATVSNSGLVTCIAPGTVSIKAISIDGLKQATCVIIVFRPVTGVKITPTALKIKVKESKKLVASVIPVNASNKGIKFISSNPKVATVNNSGVVKGVSKGKVTITAKSVEGSKTAKTVVTVV